MNFKDELNKLNIEFNDDIENKFLTYYDFLISYNEKVNLTAITKKEEVYVKHFYDSLLLKMALPKGKISLCDVGSGAGFPSIPNAIVCKDIDVTIIDSLNKRIVFLNELIKKLHLNNVCAIHKRAEEFENKESFDVVTARAVARLNILCELCMPLVKVGGLFIAMKSTESKEELNEGLNAIKILGGEVLEILEFDLPDDMGKRELIIIKKNSSSPSKYPRQFSVIKSKPLK